MKKRNRMQRLLTVVLSLTLIITMMPAMNYQWTEEADATMLLNISKRTITQCL